jgi:hypothetical protein
MRVFAFVLASIAVVTIAINVGNRIPPDAVAMGIGVILGALTSIPVSLAMGVIVGRRPQALPQPIAQPIHQEPRQYVTLAAQQRLDAAASWREYPSLVIINPAAFQQSGHAAYPAARAESIPLLTGQREFRVIGEEAS